MRRPRNNQVCRSHWCSQARGQSWIGCPTGLQPWHLPASPAQTTCDCFSEVEHLQQKSKEDRAWLRCQTLSREVGNPFLPKASAWCGYMPFLLIPQHCPGLGSSCLCSCCCCQNHAIPGKYLVLPTVIFRWKKAFLNNASTCCAEHVLTPAHNPVASDGFFIAAGFCETLTWPDAP